MKQQQELILGLFFLKRKQRESGYQGEGRSEGVGRSRGRENCGQVMMYCMREYIFNKRFKKLKKIN